MKGQKINNFRTELKELLKKYDATIEVTLNRNDANIEVDLFGGNLTGIQLVKKGYYFESEIIINEEAVI